VLHFDSKLTLIVINRHVWVFGENACIWKCTPPRDSRQGRVPPSRRAKIKKIEWGCCPEMSTLLVTSKWQTIFCALANRGFASAPGSQSPEYNILVVIRCNCLFVLVSSVLLLALATATPVAPRGHSYCTRASLLLQLCRLMSFRTSQLAGIVRFGTLSNTSIYIRCFFLKLGHIIYKFISWFY